MNVDNKSKNINNGWVIVKRYNGNTYFKGKYTRDYPSPETGTVLFDKAKAELHIAELNSKRKKVKYFLESASKHFINGWQVAIDHYNNSVIIDNPPVPIKKVADKKVSITFPAEFKTRITELLEKEIRNNDLSMQALLKRQQDDITNLANRKAGFLKVKTQLEQTDFEKMLEAYSTGAEQTLRILYEVKK